MFNQVIQGDCLIKLKELEDNSVDSIVTDPPYELGFMGKSWDNTGIANNVEMWKECLRVLKPGGHLLTFSGTRTYHRMACAIEDAGFEVRDMIEWVYGSGFPKSHNIGLRLDQKLGLQGFRGKETSFSAKVIQQKYKDGRDKVLENGKAVEKYEGKSEIAKQYQGWGTALKPAHEPICMARKPLAEKTVAENCLKYGTGGINIDESRVGTEGARTNTGGWQAEMVGGKVENGGVKSEIKDYGRFPANLIHDNSEEVRECFPEQKSSGNRVNVQYKNPNNPVVNFGGGIKNDFNDSGNASRFFKSILYYPKASKSERTAQGTITNGHPTIKPIALMEYLIKMVTPKGGTVLDPFAGSGSTLVAAKQNGYQYIGIEMTEEYIPIIEARLK